MQLAQEKTGPDRFRYLYSFHESVGLTDRRLPRRGKQARGESDMQEPVAHWGLERAYSWAFVFQASLRERYAYELVGARKVHGIPALGVKFEPRPPFERGINDLRGTAWAPACTSASCCPTRW